MIQFEIYEDTAGEYCWRLRAANGELIADSGEGYRKKADCHHGIHLIKTQASTAGVKDET